MRVSQLSYTHTTRASSLALSQLAHPTTGSIMQWAQLSCSHAVGQALLLPPLKGKQGIEPSLQNAAACAGQGLFFTALGHPIYIHILFVYVKTYVVHGYKALPGLIFTI